MLPALVKTGAFCVAGNMETQVHDVHYEGIAIACNSFEPTKTCIYLRVSRNLLMLISGTFWDRLFWKTLPLTVPLVLFSFIINRLIHFVWVDNETLSVSIYLLFGGSLFMWAIDTGHILWKHRQLHRVYIEKDFIRLDHKSVLPEDIISIQPYNASQGRLSVELILFQLSDGSVIKSLDKPCNVWKVYTEKPSKAVKLLIEHFPDLSDRLKPIQTEL